MQKSAEAFRSIGEVAELIGVAPHVLRYWETQFTLLKPMKRPDGRRYYRPDDVRLVAGLCDLLREEGLTIRGAKKIIAKDRGESVRARGDARLAKVAALPDTGLPDAQSAATLDADITSPDGGTPLLHTEPRSRQRRRRPQAGDDALPLFPDPAPTALEPAWLPRLAALSKRLQALSPRDPRWQAGQRQGAALADAIARLY